MSSPSFLGRIASCTRYLAVIGVLVCGLPTHEAAGAEAAPSADERGPRFGSVWRIRGGVTATAGKSGAQRTLRDGDPVYVGENIRSEASGEAVLKTDDAGIVALRPGASFIVEGFSALGRPTDRFSLRLLTGALRMITGWVGRTNQAEHRIITNTVTIGIRGTDHEPYVMSADLAKTLKQNAGTYDKVNRGGTTMDVGGNRLDIDPGRVGFARAPPERRQRALLTLMLPVLLDSVPDFYVPGGFDAELDQLSQAIDAEALKALNERRQRGDTPPPPPVETPAAPEPQAPAASAAPASSTAAASPPPTSAPRTSGACDANAIAKAWLGAFDAAVVRRDLSAIVRLFASDVTVRANVRGTGGAMTSVDMGRDELAQSAVAAFSGLTDYQQRRPSIDARTEDANRRTCRRISVRSVTIEQGRQGGLPYRFEALEEYMLEQRGGQWLATRAVTTQR